MAIPVPFKFNANKAIELGIPLTDPMVVIDHDYRFWDPVEREGEHIDISDVYPTVPPTHIVKWTPKPEETFFVATRSHLIVEFDKWLDIKDPNYDKSFNGFNIGSSDAKRCYSNVTMQKHLPLYLNYFEAYYDRNHELIAVMRQIKFCIDRIPDYSFENMIRDIEAYILRSSISAKAMVMVNDMYMLELDKSKFTNDKNLSLVYTDKHAKMMLWMSLLQNMIIPLATEFMIMRKHLGQDTEDGKRLLDKNAFLISVFAPIMTLIKDVNFYNKFYQSSFNLVSKSAKQNEGLWTMQDMRGKTRGTHSEDSVSNVILNIMPKYSFDQSIISFNTAANKQYDHYQVAGVPYERTCISLSSNNRDDQEQMSTMEKYEAFMLRQSPLVQMTQDVACRHIMQQLEKRYGTVTDDELQFYYDSLSDGNPHHPVISSLQRTLMFSLFGKEFGDPMTQKQRTEVDNIKLLIIGKRKLKENRLTVLAEIYAGKLNRYQEKKNINKKDLEQLAMTSSWTNIKNKYRDEKIIDEIKAILGTILASDFSMVEFDPKIRGKIHGKHIDMGILTSYVISEYLVFMEMV